MPKQGMKRPETNHRHKAAPSVPEIQGKAKQTKTPAPPVIAGSNPLKVYHSKPHSAKPFFDNDLADDNLQNDIPFADLPQSKEPESK